MQLVIGRVGRAHGIRGDVVVDVRTDEPEERLAVGATLATEPPTAGPLTVAASSWHSGRLLLRFVGVSGRTAAEALRGTLLVMDAAPDRSPADPEEFYDHQLVGLEVLTTAGVPLGTVGEVLHLPSQDTLVVRRGDGEDERELLVPFVTAIVPTVDLAARRVLIDPPAGLLDPGAVG